MGDDSVLPTRPVRPVGDNGPKDCGLRTPVGPQLVNGHSPFAPENLYLCLAFGIAATKIHQASVRRVLPSREKEHRPPEPIGRRGVRIGAGASRCRTWASCPRHSSWGERKRDGLRSNHRHDGTEMRSVIVVMYVCLPRCLPPLVQARYPVVAARSVGAIGVSTTRATGNRNTKARLALSSCWRAMKNGDSNMHTT